MLYAARIAGALAVALVLPACSLLFESGDSPAAPDAAPGDANGASCYKLSPGCPTDPNNTWLSFEDSCSCYITEFEGDRGEQIEGHDRCKGMFEAHLLVVETAEEQTAVLNGIGLTDDFHLGLFHNGQDWQWVTGEILTADSFSAFPGGGLPAPPTDQDCTVFEINTTNWDTNQCGDQDGIVCELDGRVGTTPPPI